MGHGYGGWAPYEPVAERRRKAAREMERLRKAGHPVSPVAVEGRKIATSFWGKAWCDNLESYSDYANRLPRGRTYVRNGSVIDLQIGPREVKAKVSGSQIYSVKITIEALPAAIWKAICAGCAGRVESLVELLRGRLSKAVMDRVCRRGDGLFPEPRGIGFSCSCPDSAALCKHVAAALYGVGARLDAEPELVFRLRAVDASEIIANFDAALPASRGGEGRRLEAADLSDIFGIDMAAQAPPVAAKASKSAKPPQAVKLSSPETGEGKKAARAGPAKKPARGRQPGTAVKALPRRPASREGRKPSVPAAAPAPVESAKPPPEKSSRAKPRAKKPFAKHPSRPH
jgi:uncharacterized Zn finger protein